MPSQSELADNEDLSPLPPVISNNLRLKLEAEQVSISTLKLRKESSSEEQSVVHEGKQQNPKFPLQITWHPTDLYLEIKDTVIVRKLSVVNTSSRLLYVKCGRFSNEAGRLGAGWCCLRRNRFLLAPGLMADFYIKATPRDFAPIHSATITLQLIAAHMRDIAVCTYEVPISAKFLKYIPPPVAEDG